MTPTEFQPHEPFLGSAATVITKAEFETTGFTHAHLRGATWAPWSTPSQIVPRVTNALEHGAQLVYAYYDGVDKVAHMSGFGQHYDTELALVDRLVGLLTDALPPGAALLVTADHGQVEAPSERTISGDLGRMLSSMSGEGRFRWLHASPGAAPEVAAAAQDEFGDIAWIAAVEQVRDEAWFGPRLSHEAASRLGDVAVVPHAPVAVHDPHDRGASHLVCRHGSLTADEMHVPLLWATK